LPRCDAGSRFRAIRRLAYPEEQRGEVAEWPKAAVCSLADLPFLELPEWIVTALFLGHEKARDNGEYNRYRLRERIALIGGPWCVVVLERTYV